MAFCSCITGKPETVMIFLVLIQRVEMRISATRRKHRGNETLSGCENNEELSVWTFS